MPKDKIGQLKLEKKQNDGTIVVNHYKTTIVGL
jgi:hypothetical protein